MASEIVPGLFVGSLEDGHHWAASRPGLRLIYVHEEIAPGAGPLPQSALHLPILKQSRAADGTGSLQADLEQLERIADLIERILNGGSEVLIHCAAGVERSPLAAAWYLHRRRGMSLDEAYALIRSVRPFIDDRRGWLPGFPPG